MEAEVWLELLSELLRIFHSLGRTLEALLRGAREATVCSSLQPWSAQVLGAWPVAVVIWLLSYDLGFPHSTASSQKAFH